MILMRTKNLLSVLLFLVLLSCSRGKVFEKHIKMDNLVWNRFNELSFEVPIRDTSDSYDFYVAIRHHTDIPFPRIKINFYMSTPDGETRSLDKMIYLKDENGKLLGDGLGELWDVVVPIRKGFRFNVAGDCKVEVSSRMSNVDLPGVMEVGLIVRKSKQKAD